jgi:hypothetical protein
VREQEDLVMTPVRIAVLSFVAFAALFAGCKRDEFKPVIAEKPAPEAPPAPKTAAPAPSAPAKVASRVPTFGAPAGWVVEKPTSEMRVAQYVLPRVEGDAEDATVVVTHFGGGGAGNVQGNLDRWKGMVRGADGQPSADAKTHTIDAGGATITVFEATGRYVAPAMPGKPEMLDKPGWTLITAMIPTQNGIYYPKMMGPQATVAKWRDSFLELLRTSVE